MSCCIYRPVERVFLADDEHSWTNNFFEAAMFTSREIADQIAERELGPGHDAYVFDDGIE